MSAPVAGKFQDHYAVLEIDYKSDAGMIQHSYTKLAQKYHRDNTETGDEEKFAAVNLAYEVLSDPALKADFDKIKGINQEGAAVIFSGVGFFGALAREASLRAAIMCVLYDRRRLRPFTPSLSMRILEGMMEASTEELSFALWYLKQRSLVSSDDKSSLQITVDGMDFLERNKPLPELVLLFVKPASMAPPPGLAALAKATAHEPAAETESVSKFLNRALARK